MMKAIKKLTKKRTTASSAKKKTTASSTKKKTAAKTTKTTVKKKKTTTKKIVPSEFFSMVEKKAYELYVNRGYSHGNDRSDWFEAEKLLKAKLSK